jgi:ribonuclease D
MTYKLKAGKFPIIQVENNNELQAMAEVLSKKQIIGFDTEFDGSKRNLASSLSLIQIFDGSNVYLIKVNKFKKIVPLFNVFENPRILKIGFSLVEDVRFLKLNGCNPLNIYDLKTVAFFSEYDIGSFSQLAKQVLSINIDKSKQKSEWNKRELDFEQTVYAANDVIYLIDLYQLIKPKVYKTEFLYFINEEFNSLENITPCEPFYKFTKNQKKIGGHERDAFRSIKKLVNEISKRVKCRPNNILSNSDIDKIVSDNVKVRSEANKSKGYILHLSDWQKSLGLDKEIKEILNRIDFTNTNEEKSNHNERRKRKLIKENYDKLKRNYEEFLKSKGYKIHTNKFILQGFKKMISTSNLITLDDYRSKLFREFVDTNSVEFESLFIEY